MALHRTLVAILSVNNLFAMTCSEKIRPYDSLSRRQWRFTAVPSTHVCVRPRREVVRARPGNGATDGRRNEICGVAAKRRRKQNLHFNDATNERSREMPRRVRAPVESSRRLRWNLGDEFPMNPRRKDFRTILYRINVIHTSGLTVLPK